jgi:nucleoside-diphosphate-sugar epimerase
VTILVTGGSGLVGSHVILALRELGEPVRALVREPARAAVAALGAEPVLGDVTDAAAWRRAAPGVRGIVHAAALVQQRVPLAEFQRVNVGGTTLAVTAAESAGARLVHISSVAVYGGTGAYGRAREPRDESYPFQPLAPEDRYARTKRESEEVVRAAAAAGRVAAVAIRPNVVYGERDRLFTPRVLTAVRMGLVPGVGTGTNHLSCVYAGNVAAATVAALRATTTGFRAYNVTRDSPPALSQRDFVAAFARALGRRIYRVRIPAWLMQAVLAAQGGRRLARAAISFLTGENPFVAERIHHDLGWNPPFGTVQAIERTVQAFS